jgi:hypothetical protein
MYTGRFNRTVVVEDQKKYGETLVLFFLGNPPKTLKTEESIKSGK